MFVQQDDTNLSSDLFPIERNNPTNFAELRDESELACNEIPQAASNPLIRFIPTRINESVTDRSASTRY